MAHAPAHPDQVITRVAFVPNGQHLLVGDAAGIGIWNPTGGLARWTQPAVPGGVVEAAWSPTGLWLVTVSGAGRITLWRADDGRVVRTWDGPGPEAATWAFAPNGQHLALNGADRRVLVWRIPVGEVVRELIGLQGPVRCLVYPPQGTLVAGGDATGAVGVWAVASVCTVARIGPRRQPYRLGFTPNGE